MRINNTPSYTNYKIRNEQQYPKKQVAFGNSANTAGKKVNAAIRNTLTNGIHWISKTKTMNSITNWVAKDKKRLDKLQFGSMVGLSTVLDILYARRAMKQKGIDEDKKHTLALNFLATMVFAFMGAMLLDKRLNKVTKTVQNRFMELNKEIIKKQNLKGKELEKAHKKLNAANNGIRLFKNTIIIAIVYRFTGPVLATPVASQLTKFMKNKGWIKSHNPDNEQAQKTQQV